MWKAKIQAYKHASDRTSKITEQLLIEKPIRCMFNGDVVLNGHSTPELRDHLFHGYLIAQHGPQHNLKDPEKTNYDLSITQDIKPKIRDGQELTLKTSQVKQIMANFQDNVRLYKDTGIAESAAISTSKEIIHFARSVVAIALVSSTISFLQG